MLRLVVGISFAFLVNDVTSLHGYLNLQRREKRSPCPDICAITFPPMCYNGATCSVDDQCNVKCHCPIGLAGVTCEDLETTTVTLIQLTDNETDVTSIQTTTLKSNNDCTEGLDCVDGYCGDTSHKCPNCPRGIPCSNGYCSSLPNGGIQCICYKNFSGNQCLDACQLDCGTNGTCISNNGSQVCQCDSGFLPGNCTILLSDLSKYV